VTVQKREAERLVRLAESDPLTGAANRSRLEQAVVEVKREEPPTVDAA